MFFFFFKQKTAYEMRISDWSSDVCSSDLPASARRLRPAPPPRRSPSGAPAARAAHAPAAVRRPRRGTAWARRRRSGRRDRRRGLRPRACRGIDPGSLAVLRFRVVPAGRRYRPAVLDHAVERLARFDHAQLAARALLDRGAAVFTLEFGHLGGECVIALLQAAVVAPLLFDLLRQCAHVAGAAVPEPQPVLQPRQQRAQSQRREIGRPHVCTPVTNAHLVCLLLLEKDNNKLIYP